MSSLNICETWWKHSNDFSTFSTSAVHSVLHFKEERYLNCEGRCIQNYDSQQGDWLCGENCIGSRDLCNGTCRNPQWTPNCFGKCEIQPSAYMCNGICQSVFQPCVKVPCVNAPCGGECHGIRYLDCEGRIWFCISRLIWCAKLVVRLLMFQRRPCM